MTQPNLLELAKQGNANAIASLMNQKFQPKGITAKAVMKNDSLHIMLEAAKPPNQQTLVELIRKSMTNLAAESIEKVKVYGKQTGEEFPAWNEEFEVVAQTLPNFEELAKQGDVDAIATLINQWLNSQGVTVKASLKNDCLQVKLESAEVPDRQLAVPLIRDRLIGLGIQSFKKVKIFGQQTGDDFPDWVEEFEPEKLEILPVLTPEVVAVETENSNSIVKAETPHQLSVKEESNPFSFWGSITKKVKNAGGAIAQTASSAGTVAMETATGVGVSIAGGTIQAGKTAIQKVPEVGGAIADNASQAGKLVAGKATEVGGAIAQTASGASKLALETATGVGGTITEATVQASKLALEKAAEAGTALGSATIQATKGTGYVLEIINNSPLLKNLSKTLKIDWLVKFLDAVDIVKAETEVRKLQQEYPNDKPSEIAHHLMFKKAVLAAGTGLASSLVPGTAIAMLGADLAATTALSAELLYQIATAYGYDLESPERKGEALVIFCLSFGGNLAIEAGVGLLGNIPIAGAVIGASSNAVMIYALGYAACRFYEAKLSTPLIMEATLETAQIESQKYLEAAIDQQVVMDRILVHVVLAGNSGKTSQEILPELQTLNLSPASMDAIAADIDSPPPLETLLEQINSDFAIPLLAQCEKIAQLDGVITPEETKVIETITEKFKIDMATIQVAVS